MTPSEKLPQKAKDRLNTNKNNSFVLENLPTGITPPPIYLTCRNCTHATWTATVSEVRGHCSVFHSFIHTKKEEGKLVICDKNIPEKVESVTNEPAIPEEPMNIEITAEELALMTGEELITDETDK